MSPKLFRELTLEAQEFADTVGKFSECGIRVEIDLYDMGDESYDGDVGGAAPDDVSFLRAGRYDSAFYVFPYDGVAYYGWTDYPVGELSSSSYFPHSMQENVGEAQAWSLFLMHEWLHEVVGFYHHVSWPADDVHGALAHGYRSREYGEFVNPDFFRDMMRGKVEENGELLGIRPDQYAYFGVPTMPEHY